MSDVAKVSNVSAASNGAVKYFKIQVRGWTDFDPLDKKLPEIADAIERGGGFLTAIEVLDTKDDLSAISDNVVREGFQNILAARRVLRSIGELPTSLVEDSRSAECACGNGEEAGGITKFRACRETGQLNRVRDDISFLRSMPRHSVRLTSPINLGRKVSSPLSQLGGVF